MKITARVPFSRQLCVKTKKEQSNVSLSLTQPHVEAAHLAEVDRVSVRVQDGVPGGGRAPDEHGRDAVAPGGPRVAHLDVLLLPLAVLPLRLVVQGQTVLACMWEMCC